MGIKMENQTINLIDLTNDDWELVYRLASNSQVARYMRFETMTQAAQAQDLLKEYLKPCNKGFRICLDGTENVGIAVLKKGEEREDEYDLSFYSFPEYWSRGYNTDVVRQLKEVAKRELKAKTLAAYVVSENIGSRRVLEKNQFELERILKIEGFSSELYVYSYCF